MSKTQLTTDIAAEISDNGCLVLYDLFFKDYITFHPEEIAALRLYLERNPQLGTANLEPAEKVGTANLEPAENANLEPAENGQPLVQPETPLSRNEAFRRALALAIVPAMVRTVIDRIIGELEGKS